MEITTYVFAYPPSPDAPRNGYPWEPAARAEAYRKNPTKKAMILTTGIAHFDPELMATKPEPTKQPGDR